MNGKSDSGSTDQNHQQKTTCHRIAIKSLLFKPNVDADGPLSPQTPQNAGFSADDHTGDVHIHLPGSSSADYQAEVIAAPRMVSNLKFLPEENQFSGYVESEMGPRVVPNGLLPNLEPFAMIRSICSPPQVHVDEWNGFSTNVDPLRYRGANELSQNIDHSSEENGPTASMGIMAEADSGSGEEAAPTEQPGSRRRWQKWEDDILKGLICKHGARKWNSFAPHFSGRNGRHVRLRWVNHLNPELDPHPWREEEDDVLIWAHAQYGNKWAKISAHLPGRCDNSIKNRYHLIQRKAQTNR